MILLGKDKNKEDKIEHLCEEYTESFPMYKMTIDENGLERRSVVDIGAIGKKINELVNATNKLEEKING